MTDRRTIMGVVCRFCLLGAVWIAVAAWAATFLLNVPGRTDIKARLAVPDVLVAASAGLKAKGFVHLGRINEQERVASCVQPNGQQGFVHVWDHKFYVSVAELPAEGGRLVVKGIPYGPVAWQSQTARLILVPSDCPVYLVDAQLVMDLPARSAKAFRDCMSAMKSRGRSAFFFAGDLGEFVKVERQFEPLRAETPLLYDFRTDSPLYTLTQTADRLGGAPARRRMHVVTGNVELANAAGGGGFAVHLIAKPGPQLRIGSGVRRHDSFDALAKELAQK